MRGAIRESGKNHRLRVNGAELLSLYANARRA
jgi:hypothetical protein